MIIYAGSNVTYGSNDNIVVVAWGVVSGQRAVLDIGAEDSVYHTC